MTETSKPDLPELARKHGVSESAVDAALSALQAGHGTQAQFSHPDLGGMGQWSRGGMLMIGDMFNDRLKAKVAGLFEDLLPFGEMAPASENHGQSQARWPDDLGRPSSTGSQNGMHYAVFPETQRLAVELDGKLTVYDTGDRRISGVSQQQSDSQLLSFTGPDGPVAVSDLAVVDDMGTGTKVEAAKDAPSARPTDGGDIEGRISRLHDLLTKGALTQAEFDAAKSTLLAQL
ncbi:MAG: hypothetical protein ABW048_06430 [Sphingobium sp.]